MSLEQYVAVGSAVIASISAMISVISIKVQRKTTKYPAAYTYLSTAEAMFRENPALLELHGLDLSVMKEIGVSPNEVVYLINSFTGADLYHRVEGKRRATLTTYRRALLDSPKVQRAWERIIRRRFVSEGAFSEAVDEYFLNGKSEKSGEAS